MKIVLSGAIVVQLRALTQRNKVTRTCMTVMGLVRKFCNKKDRKGEMDRVREQISNRDSTHVQKTWRCIIMLEVSRATGPSK